MSLINRKNTAQEPGRSMAGSILRLLLGLAFLLFLLLPCFLIIAEGSTWSDVPDMLRDTRSFFGNWISVCFLVGLMAAVPLFGVYLVAEAPVAMRRRIVWRREKS